MWSEIVSLSHEFTVGRQTMLNLSKHISQWYREKMSPRSPKYRKEGNSHKSVRRVYQRQQMAHQRKSIAEKGKVSGKGRNKVRNQWNGVGGNIVENKSLTERVDSFILQRKRQIIMGHKLETFEANMTPKQVHKGNAKLIKGSTYSELNAEIIEQIKSMHLTRESHQSQLHNSRRKMLDLRK